MSNELVKQMAKFPGTPEVLDSWLKHGPIVKRFNAALTGAMPTDRVIGSVMVAVANSPALLEKASIESIVVSAISAGQLGLDCGGVSGQAYLVPFKGKCKLMIGYKGLIGLAMNTGVVSDVYTGVVYRDEVASGNFIYQRGIDLMLHHIPDISKTRDYTDKGTKEVYCVYAVAVLASGEKHPDVMNVDEIEKIRSGSQQNTGTPWTKHWTEQAKKTVIRRMLKTIPIALDTDSGMTMQRAIEVDDRNYNLGLDPSKEVHQPEANGEKQSFAFNSNRDSEPAGPPPKDEPPPLASAENIKTLLASGVSHKWNEARIIGEIGLRHECDPKDMTAEQCSAMLLYVGKVDWKKAEQQSITK